jgi:small GTP-binding protein
MVILCVVSTSPGFYRAPKTIKPIPAHASGQVVKIALLSPILSPEQNEVGKSALVIRRVNNTFVELYDATIEDSYTQQIEIDGQAVVLTITDTAGQKEFAALRDVWMRGCDVLIVCSLFDRPGTLEVIESMYLECIRCRDVEKLPLVLVRTKSDLKLPFAEAGKVLRWCEKVGAGFVTTSSKTGQNELVPFEMAARMALGPREKPEVRRHD